MENLLSTTSGVSEKHTELAQTIERTPVMDCDTLRGLANRAIAEYFSTHRKHENVQRRVRGIAQGIVEATSTVYDALNQDDEPEDDIDPNELFDAVELSKLDDEDEKVDESLREILDSMVSVSVLHREPRSIYLFRIATSHPDVNLVTELHRVDHEDSSKGVFNPFKVTYNLHFAGYDV